MRVKIYIYFLKKVTETWKIKTICQNCRAEVIQTIIKQENVRPIENKFRKFNTPGLGTLQRKNHKNESKEIIQILKNGNDILHTI